MHVDLQPEQGGRGGCAALQGRGHPDMTLAPSALGSGPAGPGCRNEATGRGGQCVWLVSGHSQEPWLAQAPLSLLPAFPPPILGRGVAYTQHRAPPRTLSSGCIRRSLDLGSGSVEWTEVNRGSWHSELTFSSFRSGFFVCLFFNQHRGSNS